MSRNHSTVSHEVGYIIKEVAKLATAAEVEQAYGIKLIADGSVFDPVYNQHFPSVAVWAQFTVEQDEVLYEETFHKYSDEDTL